MPAFNEERFIAKTVIGCTPFVDKVVVVNDGSIDATAMIATACGAIVVYHDNNMGYGAAIRTCFETAKEMSARAMVIIDSDGQHDPAEIEQVLKPVLDGEADVSIGSRFMEGNELKIPFYRKVGIKVLDIATNQGSGMNFTDTQSGFRAYSKNAINKIKINNSGMSAGSEILLQIKEHGLRVKEVPISCRYDIEDTSTHNPIVHGVTVLSNILTEIEYNHPLVYFVVPGVMLLGFGCATGVFVLSSYNLNGQLPLGPTLLMMMLSIIGTFAVFSGLMLHSMTRIVAKLSEIRNID